MTPKTIEEMKEDVAEWVGQLSFVEEEISYSVVEYIHRKIDQAHSLSQESTLERVIESCGDEFDSLRNKTDFDNGPWWIATAKNPLLFGEGETRIEAVLSLKKLIDNK